MEHLYRTEPFRQLADRRPMNRSLADLFGLGALVRIHCGIHVRVKMCLVAFVEATSVPRHK